MTLDDIPGPPRTTGKPRFVSAQDVARRAGVSRSAVSRAFTPGASIAEETREKVMQAAAELGYQVNDLARGLLANRSRLVGIVATKPEVGFRADLTAALAKTLIRRGSVPLLINTGETEDELTAAQQTLFGHRAEATIVLSGSPPSSFVDLARRNGQPLVVIGRSEPETDHVMVDNIAAARLAARLFVTRGFTLLGLAGSRSATPSIVEREQAFCDEAARLGATIVVERGPDTDYAGGLAAGRALLDGQPRPRAVFCVNDLVALGVMDAARTDLGLAVPGDVAVIGFDDVPQADWLAYRLTTFRQDPELMAARAVAVLDRRQQDPAGPLIAERIEARLVVRDSFAPAE
ncbi:DNA-binding LacI/PurR family transcriptional regulator [Chelatococcus caeni]|uniref:DNA-binding LacI/PurR family transcriptional regulator n=1 Tax=Chelatococcus caeni TaxID=1348468 RepID=A0A840BZM1_9HYPH|nr:LacI family DNA-binding transcriptional regulator [Chelatococcus caeni]MBB4019001.1 DNA-binding LacI/PurR family transcriptional regulator [Chelatococcus caeni]